MKPLVIAACMVALAAAPAAAFGRDNIGHGMNFGNFTPGHSTHQEIIDGVKATFNIQIVKDSANPVPSDGNETHRLTVSFNDTKTGTAITEGEVKARILAGDNEEQAMDMIGRHGYFMADFNLARKGKYRVLCKFRLGDGKTRSAKFWYELK